MTAPREGIVWNSSLQRFEWWVKLPDGHTITGHAPSEGEARHDMESDWRVRGEELRYVVRMPRGGVASLPSTSAGAGRPRGLAPADAHTPRTGA